VSLCSTLSSNSDDDDDSDSSIGSVFLLSLSSVCVHRELICSLDVSV